ncbi:hypothetical protein G5714_020301 [Onychostoma macrolepis]|uniref:Uncharacterized protein n=1 Tax=Onychostoma macrolepis TaxID=369639 RepID=A0A7J6BU62_9TELE|nr:hypothetical protein G5714_020301 [Onychostoma macrolepis]
MGTIFCHHHQPIVGQIKTPVPCMENPRGSGGVIINDLETFTMNKQHLVTVLLSRGEKLHQTSSIVTASEDKKEKCLPRP